MGLHPSEILIGYEKASKYAMELLDEATCYEIKDVRNYDEMLRCMKATVASKQYGLEDLLGGLITQACQHAISTSTGKFSTDNIRVQKILGGGIEMSEVVQGMVVVRQSETSIHKAFNCKVAVFNSNIERN